MLIIKSISLLETTRIQLNYKQVEQLLISYYKIGRSRTSADSQKGDHVHLPTRRSRTRPVTVANSRHEFMGAVITGVPASQ